MKRTIIIFIFIISVMIGYAWEFMPNDKTVGFIFNTLRINSQWYYYILFKDIRVVLLVWLAWYMIPKNETSLKLGSSIFAVMITFVPINFFLFYSTPFNAIYFIVKIISSIIIGFFITYFSNQETNDIDSHSF